MIKPVHDIVIIKRSESESITKGGIIIAESAKSISIRGVVKAVGPGKRLDNGTLLPIGVSVGDTVIVDSEYAGQEITIEGEELLALHADEVLAIEEL